jgi:hypothetical protein
VGINDELNAFRLLDCDPRVTVFTEQPCEIVYVDGTETRRHCPDTYVEIDSNQELWEVKAECEASLSEVSTPVRFLSIKCKAQRNSHVFGPSCGRCSEFRTCKEIGETYVRLAHHVDLSLPGE